MSKYPKTDQVLATDASLKGGMYKDEYYHARFPKEWADIEDIHITHFELLALVVGLKIWQKQLYSTYIWVHVDNEAVATIVNSGRSKGQLLQELLREFVFICLNGQFIVNSRHIHGVHNRVTWSTQ